jgi:MFS family permease
VLASSASNENVAYAALLALAVVDASGYSVIAPVAPALAHASGAGPALIGSLVASFPLGMVVGFALAGAAVKRGHRATLLAVSLTLVAAGCLGFVFGHALTVWFLARVVMGLGSGGLWMGITFATLERWPGQEYLCMSRVFAAYSVGGLVGPALGAIGGIRGPFAAYLALVGASGTCALMLRSTSTRRHFRADRAALRLRGFWVASAAISFVVLALGTVEGVLPLHFASQLDQRTMGILYAASAVVVAASAALAARARPRLPVLGACVLIVSGLGFAGSSASIPIWIGALILVGIGIGIGNTGAIGLLFAAVGAERIVTAMIIWSQIGILGYLAGPLVGGLAAQALGYGAVAIVPLVLALPLVAFLVLRSSELDGTGGAAR